MCTKKRFTLLEALRVGRKFGQRPYQCPKCKCWHLTKSTEQDYLNKVLSFANVVRVFEYDMTLEEALRLLDSYGGCMTVSRMQKMCSQFQFNKYTAKV